MGGKHGLILMRLGCVGVRDFRDLALRAIQITLLLWDLLSDPSRFRTNYFLQKTSYFPFNLTINSQVFFRKPYFLKNKSLKMAFFKVFLCYK